MPVTSLLRCQSAHVSDGENTGPTGQLATGDTAREPPGSALATQSECLPSSTFVTFGDEVDDFWGGGR